MAENGNGGNVAITGADKYTHNYDAEEIDPLQLRGSAEKTDRNRLTDTVAAVEITPDVSDSFVPMARKPSKLRGTYEAVLARLDITARARLPFLLVILLCVLLLIVVIAMCAFWPRIPYYMRADVCVDVECLDSSAQVSRFCLVDKLV